MKRFLWWGLLSASLFGCVSNFDSAGNYKDYYLTPEQAHVVAVDMAAQLKASYPARVIFSFPHTETVFTNELENAIRDSGLGLSVADVPSYHRLRVKVSRLNDTQFYSQLLVDNVTFSKIWVEQDNTLVPLNTTTTFGGQHE
ncbi:hypothetical protein [Vibrio parahaemolyticus]|uniref:hypothetical protein n=1 Tax=Vibrio parahaemolyticus TaxID=670 RepID=UPI0017859EDB|nr:hypothetical protein [Vibrio parahaemolyticus]MBD6944387.1 hypothetical protein [Vibrio parahaemolyticus]MBD6978932.1 hypothetical protein [Vibrio parahaemolyticus]WOZ62898.1 hypothetical protein RHS38_26135 [Vibrio parahaemolyticus]